MNKSRSLVLTLLFLAFAVNAQAKVRVFGPNERPGTQVLDYNRNLSLKTPSSYWNLSLSETLISMTHAKDYDVFISLQESVYRSELPQRAFHLRKTDLKEFMPHAYFWIEEESVTVGGAPAYLMRYEDIGKDRLYQEVFFVRKNIAYQMSFVAKPATFFKHEETFKEILSQIQFL